MHKRICDICLQPETSDNSFQEIYLGDGISYNTRCLRCTKLVLADNIESERWILVIINIITCIFSIIGCIVDSDI